MPCGVRVLKPTLTSFMHVSCHVNQASRQRQEVARGDGHLQRHMWGLPCGDPTCGAEGTRARCSYCDAEGTGTSGAIRWAPCGSEYADLIN